MNENLLHFIWQNRFFGNGPYYTIDGSQLEIVHLGTYNFNQGPDFLNARIKINQTEWAGNIEIHIQASDWNKHAHEKDPNFRNIILHIVWMNDKVIFDQFGFALPTFCIQPYISNHLLIRYKSLLQTNPFARPCYSFLPAISPLKWLAWKERLVIERLESKSLRICNYLSEAKNDWETITWWMIAANMGLKVNEHLFESIARSISLRLIAKHRTQIHQLEAMLIGQANLLDSNYKEQYPQLLQKEYRFLRKKYRLGKQVNQPAFLRMRPASFPTLRLAQLAKLVQDNQHFFDFFKNTESLAIIQLKLMVIPNDYWLYHYRFDEPGPLKEKKLGKSMVNSLIINTVIPLIYAYGTRMNEPILQEKAINWLMELKPELNKITNDWTKYKVQNHTAFDSQALIELNNNYCKLKKCLDCSVGISILGST